MVILMDTVASTDASISNGLFARQGLGVYTSEQHTTLRFSIRSTSVFCQPAERRTDRKSQLQTFPQADAFLKEQIRKLRMRNEMLLALPIPVTPWKACFS